MCSAYIQTLNVKAFREYKPQVGSYDFTFLSVTIHYFICPKSYHTIAALCGVCYAI